MSSQVRKKKRLKSLTHKVEHLRLEVEDHDETAKEFEAEFFKSLTMITDGTLVSESQNPVPLSSDEQQHIEINKGDEDMGDTFKEVDSGKKNEELSEEIKKIWKAIVLCTHPDRTNNDPEKTEMYLAAIRAGEEGSVDEILRIAGELNIDIPDESPVVEAKLEKLASELESKLKTTEESVLWQWGNGDHVMKAKIMDVYISMRKLKKKSFEVV